MRKVDFYVGTLSKNLGYLYTNWYTKIYRKSGSMVTLYPDL